MPSKPISLFYCKGQNFGDVVNPMLIERVLGVKCAEGTKEQSNLIAIGSILQRFSTNNVFQNIIKNIYPTLHVFGSGFISDETYKYFKRKIMVHAVRGYYTKAKCEKILGQKLDVPVGDGGLLLSYLLEKRPVKKYALGVIPHVSDWKNPIFEKIIETPNSTLIDLRSDPLTVLNQIAECETVVSTALHGLIASDSLGIPNKWLEVSNNVKGNGYKFHDYYSAYGIENVQPLRCSGSGVDILTLVDIQAIQDDYRIAPDQVQKIQQDLLKAFPFK